MGRTCNWEDFPGHGVTREAEDTFTSQKRQEALDAGEADRGEDEVRGRDAIMEDL